MPDDAAALQRYAETRDAEAFAELVNRYAGLVYGICLRVTEDAHDADDAAQECFMELARCADSVTSSLPGWLHVAATRRSLDAVRRASTRRRHEGQAMSQAQAETETGWPDIAPHVDEALAELPEELRTALVVHFLRGLTQQETAAELGVDQSTVSRRIEKGLDDLREKLRQAGVVASVAALGTLLSENAATAAPATLLTSLGKMAMSGVGQGASATTAAAEGAAATGGSAGTPASAAGTFLGSVGGKVAVVAAISVLVVAGVVTYRQVTRPKPAPAAPAARQPAKERAREVRDIPQKVDVRVPVHAGDALPDAVLLDALEKGRALVSVEILSFRMKEERATKFYLYKARALKLIVAGDLAPADIQSPIDLFAGASYGEALTVGSKYALFVAQYAPQFFSWTHRDDVMKIGPEDSQAVKQLEARASRVYTRTRLHRFRNAKAKVDGELPPIPEGLKATCAKFKSHKGRRCEPARSIWESDIGSRPDESRPWASFISYLPPKIRLSRAQALELLGKPSIKVGYGYKWFCGRDSQGHAGVLTIRFSPNGMVRSLVYGGEPLGHWVPEKEAAPKRST